MESKSSTLPMRSSSRSHPCSCCPASGFSWACWRVASRVSSTAHATWRRSCAPEARDADRIRSQLQALSRRARYINIAITLGTIAALLVAIVIALLFSSTFIPLNLAPPLALLFVLAMCALVAAFVSFLVEVRVAIAVLRIGDV
jgi:hypothetical protein